MLVDVWKYIAGRAVLVCNVNTALSLGIFTMTPSRALTTNSGYCIIKKESK